MEHQPMSSVRHPPTTERAIRLIVVKNVLIWTAFTIICAELAPVCLVRLESKPEQGWEPARHFVGQSGLLLAAFGVYCATWADRLVRWPRWSSLEWLGYIGCGLFVAWAIRARLVSEFIKHE